MQFRLVLGSALLMLALVAGCVSPTPSQTTSDDGAPAACHATPAHGSTCAPAPAAAPKAGKAGKDGAPGAKGKPGTSGEGCTGTTVSIGSPDACQPGKDG